MRRSSTRRAILATLGTTGTLSIAGCSTIFPAGPVGNSGKQVDSTTSTDSSNQETNKSTDAGPFSRGQTVEDFEGNVDSRWDVSTGKYTIDGKNQYQGSQSIVLTGQNNDKQKKENGVSIRRSFYESGGLNLQKYDLSLAVRFEQPARGRLAVEFIAPADSSKLTSQHFIPKELNGWTRIDLGYTGKTGTPVMEAVQELQISVNTSGEPITVGIDDIRKIPKAKNGKVMFQFDDSHITAYTKAFPELKQLGWTGGVGAIPSTVNTSENMTRSQMREMGTADWDMMSHPHPSVGKPLSQLPPKKNKSS